LFFKFWKNKFLIAGEGLKKIDIRRHELVPKHVIPTKKERENLLKTYGISIKHLPRILESDPVVKTIGAEVGDIIKIVRKSQTAGEITYYRIVVKG